MATRKPYTGEELTNHRRRNSGSIESQLEKSNEKKKSNSSYDSSFWARNSGKKPTAEQQRKYLDQKSIEEGAAAMGRQEEYERQLEKNRKKKDWKKSQRNNSKGYKNMLERRNDANIKKYEEAFGRKVNRGDR